MKVIIGVKRFALTLALSHVVGDGNECNLKTFYRRRAKVLRIRMNRLTPRKLVWQICLALLLILLNAFRATSQDKRAKVRISNAGFTITALPLLAAKDWGTFSANGLDVELIVMSPSIAAAALAQGDIDYVAGVGPASVAATLSGLQSRAIWFSSDRISYWLQAMQQ